MSQSERIEGTGLTGLMPKKIGDLLIAEGTTYWRGIKEKSFHVLTKGGYEYILWENSDGSLSLELHGISKDKLREVL